MCRCGRPVSDCFFRPQDAGASCAVLGRPTRRRHLTTSTTPSHIQENFAVSTLPDDAMREIRESMTTKVRFNAVVGTGVPGFIAKS
jgi:hypothetical protein